MHLKMVKKVNFMVCVTNHNFKRQTKTEGNTDIGAKWKVPKAHVLNPERRKGIVLLYYVV